MSHQGSQGTKIENKLKSMGEREWHGKQGNERRSLWASTSRPILEIGLAELEEQSNNPRRGTWYEEGRGDGRKSTAEERDQQPQTHLRSSRSSGLRKVPGVLILYVNTHGRGGEEGNGHTVGGEAAAHIGGTAGQHRPSASRARLSEVPCSPQAE